LLFKSELSKTLIYPYLLGELPLRSLVIEHTGPGGLFGQAADIRAFVSWQIKQLLNWMEAAGERRA
jgi:hypothetical protein